MYSWYLQNGENSDVVTSSRIRLARNLKEVKFVNKGTSKELEDVINKIEDVLLNIGYGLKLIKLKDIDNLTKLCLIEKHLISPDFAMNNTDIGAILVNDDENICIMLNEEDHIRIQVFSSGLDLEHLNDLATELDKKIEGVVNYAFNEKYGFLTACPTNVGTGMRASVMVHLPALTATKNINKVLDVLNNFGMNIRGVYGEGSNSQGDMYQISNKISLGLPEKEIITITKTVTDKIIEQERLARKYMARNSVEFEDKIYRAYGLLSNCRKISTEECKKLLSYVKLGVDLGIMKELNDLKIAKLDLYTKPANLQKYVGKELDENLRDITRADVIKQIIME